MYITYLTRCSQPFPLPVSAMPLVWAGQCIRAVSAGNCTSPNKFDLPRWCENYTLFPQHSCCITYPKCCMCQGHMFCPLCAHPCWKWLCFPHLSLAHHSIPRLDLGYVRGQQINQFVPWNMHHQRSSWFWGFSWPLQVCPFRNGSVELFTTFQKSVLAHREKRSTKQLWTHTDITLIKLFRTGFSFKYQTEGANNLNGNVFEWHTWHTSICKGHPPGEGLCAEVRAQAKRKTTGSKLIVTMSAFLLKGEKILSQYHFE